MSPSILTGVARLKTGCKSITAWNSWCPHDFFSGRPRIKPGGGAGLAISDLSPTNSFEANGSGVPFDAIDCGRFRSRQLIAKVEERKLN